MGLRTWFGRLLGRDGSERREEKPAGSQPASSADSGDSGDEEYDGLAAVRSVSASRAQGQTANTRGVGSNASPRNPLEAIAGQPVSIAVTRVMDLLDVSPSASEAAALLRWLRGCIDDPALPPDARVRVSDFFAARGEVDTAARALASLVTGGDALAPPALMRLADLAHQRGDVAEAARLYEEVIAIDLDYPGARDRLARDRAPTRAGGAGATLLSPEAAQLAGGRFALVRELGRGGAGAVFLSLDRRAGRDVALKIYHPTRRSDRNARLRAEAQVASSLASRHVVRVYDLFEDLGGLAMEHCSGGSLNTDASLHDASIESRRGWARDVAHGLAVTHDRSWVHRDLKPGNVLLRADGAAVLTDYGLARRAGAPVEAYEGTPGYVPPEVRARAGLADPRIDVYAFGALARALLGDADEVLGAVVRAALAANPESRPRDGAALLHAIDAATAESP